MAIPILLNRDGSPFDDRTLNAVKAGLQDLSAKADRVKVRDRNAHAIAVDDSTQLLIVSGPGTGKSWLFKRRIEHWTERYPADRVLVTSFVNKLVNDLRNDLYSGKSERDVSARVVTLHAFALSILQKNGGNSRLKLVSPIAVIVGGRSSSGSQSWQDRVWGDALEALTELDPFELTCKDYLSQVYRMRPSQDVDWRGARLAYHRILKFYNAVGYGDMIEQAVVAAAENPGIVNEKLLIIDEYQDFNASEDALIENVVRRAKGVMIAGDDEQVLYTSLRDGTPDLIRERYQSDAFAKAMLPLCSRCGFHICRASRHFADSVLKDESIHKVFEPLDTDDKGSPIKMVACPLPSSALDYIERFLKEHEHEITERQIAINDGSNTDHCVLILSQSATASFLKTKRSQKRYDALLKTIRDYECAPEQEQSRRDMDYIAVFEDSTDNYRLRRVLYHEGVEDPVVRQLIHEAIGRGVSLSELESPVIEAAIKTCADVIESSLRDAHETMDIVAEFQKLQEAALDDLTRVHGSPVELITIQKAKGLTADHVLLLGFDDTNMSYVSQSAFYVALTRAKVSLHIVTSLGAGGASRPHDYLDLLPDENLEFFTHTVRDATSEPLSSRQHYLKYLENCEERNRRFRK